MKAEAESPLAVARILRKREPDGFAPRAVERLAQQSRQLALREEIDDHESFMFLRSTVFAVEFDLESVQLGGCGPDFKCGHVESIAVFQVAQAYASEPESIRRARFGPMSSQIDE